MKLELLGLVALSIVELFQSSKMKRTEITHNCKLTERENFLSFSFYSLVQRIQAKNFLHNLYKHNDTLFSLNKTFQNQKIVQ